jgi:hypothetical protein
VPINAPETIIPPRPRAVLRPAASRALRRKDMTSRLREKDCRAHKLHGF